MDFNKFIHIGTARKTHGLKGSLDIRLAFPLKKNKSRKLKSLFIGNTDKPLPYFIEEFILPDPEYCRVKLEGINSREDATKLCLKDVFTDEKTFGECFSKPGKNETASQSLIGYKMMDDAKNEIGLIDDVLEFPGQRLAQLQYKGREILIPLNDETVISINKKEKTVQVKIAEGLLEIF